MAENEQRSLHRLRSTPSLCPLQRAVLSPRFVASHDLAAAVVVPRLRLRMRRPPPPSYDACARSCAAHATKTKRGRIIPCTRGARGPFVARTGPLLYLSSSKYRRSVKGLERHASKTTARGLSPAYLFTCTAGVRVHNLTSLTPPPLTL